MAIIDDQVENLIYAYTRPYVQTFTLPPDTQRRPKARKRPARKAPRPRGRSAKPRDWSDPVGQAAERGAPTPSRSGGRFDLEGNMAGSKRREAGAHGGFTFVELLVSLSLFAAVSFVVLQAFVAAMGHSGGSHERVGAPGR